MASLSFDSIGGRRFFLTCVSGAAATLLQWFGRLDPAGSTYALIISATVAAYIAGNTMQKTSGAKPTAPTEQQP